jgi:hypothetical protein
MPTTPVTIYEPMLNHAETPNECYCTVLTKKRMLLYCPGQTDEKLFAKKKDDEKRLFCFLWSPVALSVQLAWGVQLQRRDVRPAIFGAIAI